MFKLTKIEGGRINVFEPLVLKVGTTAVTSGQGLILSGGLLVTAGAGKPAYIALADGAANSEIAVGRVEPNQLYEVETSEALEGVNVGDKVTLSAGTKVTKTTNNGVAEIVSLNGATAAGDTVIVRFS